jgi:hypothetical protein
VSDFYAGVSGECRREAKWLPGPGRSIGKRSPTSAPKTQIREFGQAGVVVLP